jgi:hypothetical protein
MSAHGNASMHGDLLLGHAALAIHATPQLTRERTRALLRATQIQPPALRKLLTQSGLADQEEAIRLTPEDVGIDDTATLWNAFHQPYRPSFAFQASVVLMRPDPTQR